MGQLAGFATEAAGQGGAYYGEIIRAGNDVQVQVVHYLAQYPTAFDQFDFSAGVGGGFQQAAQVFHARQAACFLFYLDQGVGAVYRRLDQGVEHADGGEHYGYGGNQPFAVPQGADQGQQVYFVVLRGCDAGCCVVCHVIQLPRYLSQLSQAWSISL